METNKSLAITGENNLPEVIQDKLGNINEIKKNFKKFGEIASISVKEAQEAIDRMNRIFPLTKNLSDLK